jgi:hypothetical protein
VLKIVFKLHGQLGHVSASTKSFLEAPAVFKLKELLNAGVTLSYSLFSRQVNTTAYCDGFQLDDLGRKVI